MSFLSPFTLLRINLGHHTLYYFKLTMSGSGDMPIDEAKLKEIEDAVNQSGVALGDASHSIGGWEGGTVWLVSTEKGIEDWKPIATRTL